MGPPPWRMARVWARTHYDWSGDNNDEPGHVHHAAENLTAWLAGVAVTGAGGAGED